MSFHESTTFSPYLLKDKSRYIKLYSPLKISSTIVENIENYPPNILYESLPNSSFDTNPNWRKDINEIVRQYNNKSKLNNSKKMRSKPDRKTHLQDIPQEEFFSFHNIVKTDALEYELNQERRKFEINCQNQARQWSKYDKDSMNDVVMTNCEADIFNENFSTRTGSPKMKNLQDEREIKEVSKSKNVLTTQIQLEKIMEKLKSIDLPFSSKQLSNYGNRTYLCN